ncbi:MAG: hypothetical protein JWQ02_3386 [Capsulimonas sp.]|nr:hypothetical protein [Capsulimonas sp.]
MTDSNNSKTAAPARPPLPKALQWILRITGVVALLLFLAPTVYVIKYCLIDSPRESRLASQWSTTKDDPALLHALASTDPDNIALATKTAQKHASAPYRLAAVQSLGKILAVKGVSYRRPMETVTAKATLGQIAVHDKDPEVRSAASTIIGEIAKNGAVLRR